MDHSKIITCQTHVSQLDLLHVQFDNLEKIVKREMAYKLSEEMLKNKNVEFEEQIDHQTGGKIITARMVVLTPKEYNELYIKIEDLKDEITLLEEENSFIQSKIETAQEVLNK